MDSLLIEKEVECSECGAKASVTIFLNRLIANKALIEDNHRLRGLLNDALSKKKK